VGLQHRRHSLAHTCCHDHDLVPELVYCVQWRAEWNRTSQQDHDAFAVSHDASFDDTCVTLPGAAVGLSSICIQIFEDSECSGVD